MIMAILGSLFAVFLCVAAVASYLRARDNTAIGIDNTQRIEQVHKLVNSQLSMVLDRVDQLTDLLESKGIAVPDAPAKMPHSKREKYGPKEV